MGKQDFEYLDYVGVLVVGAVFTVTLFVISFFVINFFCITKYDDFTKFEEFGAKKNWRLGPHPLKMVQKGKFEYYEEEESEQ